MWRQAYNVNTIGKVTKKTAVLSSTILILFFSVISVTPSFAASLDFTGLSLDPEELNFRDILITEGISDPTVTLNPAIFHNGDTVTMNIQDHNANVDLTIAEQITAFLGGSPITLTETGGNTGNFQLSIIGQFFSFAYDSVSELGVPRATVNLDLATAGTVRIEDVIIPSGGGLGCVGFDPVIHPVKVSFPDTATLDSFDSIMLSYANGVLNGGDPELLKMWFKPTGGGGWLLVTEQFDDPLNPDAHDTVGKTVMTDASIATIAGFVGTLGDGQYVIGFATGCGGGGGGGLQTSGLVLNFLAAVLAGAGGKDLTAPSLAYGSTSSYEFDPSQPTPPSTDSGTQPLMIGNNGYPIRGYSTGIVPYTAKTGEKIDTALTFSEASKVKHVALHFVDENKDEMSDRDPTITYDNGNVVKSDPEGILGDDIYFTTSRDGTKTTFNFGFSFDKASTHHLMINAWDDKMNSANTKIFNAFDISGPPVPQEVNQLILQDAGQYVITQDGVISIEDNKKAMQQEPVAGFVYPESIGKLERHDMELLYNALDNEQKKASSVIASFKLDTTRFIADDEKLPDAKRAPALTWSTVGNKIRDFTKSPQENSELIKELCWQEHLRAEKTLKSLYGTIGSYQD